MKWVEHDQPHQWDMRFRDIGRVRVWLDIQTPPITPREEGLDIKLHPLALQATTHNTNVLKTTSEHLCKT